MQLIGDNIVISDRALYYLKNFLESAGYSRVFVLVDENTREHCLPLLEGFSREIIEIPSGEENKQLETCTRVWDALLNGGADRKSVLINLGGGVIGDLGGFCASTYMRGIDFIQCPTTLLAMVDASVGGKLGVDYRLFKNTIGLFVEPKMVFIHPPLLDTLSERHILAGYAEMLKHGLISNPTYWKELKSLNHRKFKLQIEDSVRIKKSVVEEDPEETGLRKVLNFGHTIGHAIESWGLAEGVDILHGEAVAAGMYMEAIISAKTGLTREDIDEVTTVLRQLYPRLNIPLEASEAIWQYTLRDKKNENGSVMATLLQSIGEAVYNIRISYPEFREALRNYLSVG